MGNFLLSSLSAPPPLQHRVSALAGEYPLAKIGLSSIFGSTIKFKVSTRQILIQIQIDLHPIDPNV